jgi:hypothetical protein
MVLRKKVMSAFTHRLQMAVRCKCVSKKFWIMAGEDYKWIEGFTTSMTCSGFNHSTHTCTISQ